jgi:signal transduction histidine kinase
MPLAMAALDVAGQIRERSPTDMAIFGENAGRLGERFVDPEAGQALLARAVGDGSAEAEAWLRTQAGEGRFRVGLWRQRGGERIRVLAVFSAFGSTPDTCGGEVSSPVRDSILRLGRDMRAPIDAVAGFAGLLRADPEGLRPEDVSSHASDILSAAWRLIGIADDLLATGGASGRPPALRAGEVDVARLVRRIARLAAPAAQAARVTIDHGNVPVPGEGPLVLGDESSLWSAIDGLLQNALRHAGRGSTVRLGLSQDSRGVVIEVADDGPGIEAGRLAGLFAATSGDKVCGLAICRAMVRANGAELEIETAPRKGLRARIMFPAARCLNPV